MRLDQISDRIVAKVQAFVEGFLRESCTWPEGRQLYVAEHKALALARAMARELLAGMLKSMGTGHCGQRHTGGDGVERTFNGYVTKTVQTVVGPVSIRCARYYRKGADPACAYPLRERLGVPTGDYSEGMEEVIALAGTDDVYRRGLLLVKRLTGTDVSVHKAETTTASWGTAVKAKHTAPGAEPESRPERIAATQPIQGLRMCVTTDGTSVQTTQAWRDAKLMVTYPFDKDGKKAGRATYRGTLHYQNDYGTLVWELMEQTQASRAETLVWLGDGASWIWNQQATVAPHAVPILDFYHAADRLWRVGRAVYAPSETRQAKQWTKKWIKNLYQGKAAALLAEIAAQCERLGEPPPNSTDDDPRKIAAHALTYFTHNASRMDYKRYRRHGYPIGSGIVESACRHIVGLRMKRTATMAWQEANAEAMLQLRCLCASEQWDDFWGYDTLWKTIRAPAA